MSDRITVPRIASRETAGTKARRYFVEGRLRILEVTPTSARAEVHGDSGHMHSVVFNENGWWCSCPARGDACSHLRALRLVTAFDRDAR